MVRADTMAGSFAIIYLVACTYVELGRGQDIRRPGEVCNSRNLMMSILHEVTTAVREDGSISELDRNDSSDGNIITKLIPTCGSEHEDGTWELPRNLESNPGSSPKFEGVSPYRAWCTSEKEWVWLITVTIWCLSSENLFFIFLNIAILATV